MDIVENIKLVWGNSFYLCVTLFFIFLTITIFCLILTISDIIERKTDGIFLTICLFFFLLTLFCYLNIYNNANDLRKKTMEKQVVMEEHKEKNHINKMCFILDTNIKSDLKKDDFIKMTMRDLSVYAGRIYWNLTNTQKDYYKKNKTSDGFSDNKEFSKIYSLGYQNLLKIKEEINSRRVYCFKNYCNDIYYDKTYDDIEVNLKDLIKLKCKEK